MPFSRRNENEVESADKFYQLANLTLDKMTREADSISTGDGSVTEQVSLRGFRVHTDADANAFLVLSF